MPLFEYRCADCRRKFTLLEGMTAEAPERRCTHCGSERVEKLISRFARGRSEDERVDEIADNLESIGEPDSPSEMRRMMREMGKAMDEDMADDMEEMFEADMAGEGDDDF